MGNVERCDKTLPLNEMIFYVRRDARLRERWMTDFDGLVAVGLSDAEREPSRQDPRGSWTSACTSTWCRDPALFFGDGQNTNASPALEHYSSLPGRNAQAMALQARLEGGSGVARSVAAWRGRFPAHGLFSPRPRRAAARPRRHQGEAAALRWRPRREISSQGPPRTGQSTTLRIHGGYATRRWARGLVRRVDRHGDNTACPAQHPARYSSTRAPAAASPRSMRDCIEDGFFGDACTT